MTMLSKYFSLEQMIASPTAARLGISNEPNASQFLALQALTNNIMDELDTLGPDEYLAGNIHVVSGLRSEALNAATPGASKTSQHCLGEACDFTVEGQPVGLVTLRLATSNLPFDQVILEYAQEGNPMAGWTHVSHGPRKRKEVLTCVRGADGKPQYSAGLPVWVHKLYGANA